MPEAPESGTENEAGEKVGGFLIDSAQETMKHAGETMLRDTPKITRYVLTRIPEGPGLALQATQLLTAKDKLRAGVGIAGSVAGGVAGGVLGGPVGSVIGSTAGDELATELYDHRADIQRGLEATKQWMADRTAEISGRR